MINSSYLACDVIRYSTFGGISGQIFLEIRPSHSSPNSLSYKTVLLIHGRAFFKRIVLLIFNTIIIGEDDNDICSRFIKMKIKLLTRSSDLNEILLAKLNQIGLTGQTIDYKRPILPQIADAEVIINGFGIIDKSFIDECPNLQLIQQTGIGVIM